MGQKRPEQRHIGILESAKIEPCNSLHRTKFDQALFNKVRRNWEVLINIHFWQLIRVRLLLKFKKRVTAHQTEQKGRKTVKTNLKSNFGANRLFCIQEQITQFKKRFFNFVLKSGEAFEYRMERAKWMTLENYHFISDDTEFLRADVNPKRRNF